MFPVLPIFIVDFFFFQNELIIMSVEMQEDTIVRMHETIAVMGLIYWNNTKIKKSKKI